MAKKKQFTAKQREEILKQSRRFWEDATQAMEPLFTLVNDTEKMWRVQLPDKLKEQMDLHPDRAALPPPDAYININSLRAGLKRLLFARKPYATLSILGQPALRDERITKAEWVLQQMLDMQNEGRGFESEADKAILQALYAGVGATFTRWEKRKVRKEIRDNEGNIFPDPDTGEIQFYRETVAEYAELKAIDIRRIRIDPEAENLDTIKKVGYHYIQNLSELLRLNRDPDSDYDFKEKELIEESSFVRDKYYEYVFAESEAFPERTKGITKGQDIGDSIVEVQEIRGLYKFEQKGKLYFQDLIVRIGNDKVLLSIKRNDLPIPGWNLFNFPTVDSEISRMYPMGVVEPMMQEWLEKFIKLNQSLDEGSRRIYTTYIGDKSACEDLPDVIPYIPNQILGVDLMASGAPGVSNVLQPVQVPPLGQDVFVQADMLTQTMQQGYGLNDYTQGMDPKRKETATAVVALDSGGKSLLSEKANKLKDSFLAPAYLNHLILWNFFVGNKKNMVVTDQGEKIDVAPSELNLPYVVGIDISTELDRPEMVRRLIEALPGLKVDPQIDQYQLTKTELEVLKIPNPNRLLPPSKHLQIIVERENAALLNGVPQPVSQYDNDSFHMKNHLNALNYVRKMPSAERQARGITDSVLMDHIKQHQQSAQQKAAELSNTKDLGGGRGDMVNAQAGAIKQGTGSISGTPRSGRA